MVRDSWRSEARADRAPFPFRRYLVFSFRLNLASPKDSLSQHITPTCSSSASMRGDADSERRDGVLRAHLGCRTGELISKRHGTSIGVCCTSGEITLLVPHREIRFGERAKRGGRREVRREAAEATHPALQHHRSVSLIFANLFSSTTDHLVRYSGSPILASLCGELELARFISCFPTSSRSSHTRPNQHELLHDTRPSTSQEAAHQLACASWLQFTHHLSSRRAFFLSSPAHLEHNGAG